MLYQQLPIESTRVVEVDFTSLFHRYSCIVVVIGILWYEGYFVGGQALYDFAYDCCFSGARASGYSDNIHGYSVFVLIYILVLGDFFRCERFAVHNLPHVCDVGHDNGKEERHVGHGL